MKLTLSLLFASVLLASSCPTDKHDEEVDCYMCSSYPDGDCGEKFDKNIIPTAKGVQCVQGYLRIRYFEQEEEVVQVVRAPLVEGKALNLGDFIKNRINVKWFKEEIDGCTESKCNTGKVTPKISSPKDEEVDCYMCNSYPDGDCGEKFDKNNTPTAKGVQCVQGYLRIRYFEQEEEVVQVVRAPMVEGKALNLGDFIKNRINVKWFKEEIDGCTESKCNTGKITPK